MASPFEFYFSNGVDGGFGTDGSTYGYVMVRTTEAADYGYSFDGYLCDDDIDDVAIASICGSFGYYNWSAMMWGDEMSVNRKIPMVLDDLACDTVVDEPALGCTYRYPVGSTDCLHDEGVWVSCDNGGFDSEGEGLQVHPVQTDGNNQLQFMLTEGDHGYLYTPHGWVCDHDLFDEPEAEVVCYEMGLGLDHYHTEIDLETEVDTTYLPFEVFDYEMGLDQFSCPINPTGLSSCFYTYEYDGACNHQQGLYLDCSAVFIDLSPRTSSGLEVWVMILLIILSIVLLALLCGFCYLIDRRKRLRRQQKCQEDFNGVLADDNYADYGPGAAPADGTGSRNRVSKCDTFDADPGPLPTESWESDGPIDGNPEDGNHNVVPSAQLLLGNVLLPPAGSKNERLVRNEGSLIYKRPTRLNTNTAGNQQSNSLEQEGENSE